MIDWQRVTSLRDEIGDDDFQDIVPIFIDEVTEITDKLRNATDLDQLEHDLHALKGSALNLGFSEFCALCDRGESLAANGNAEQVDITAILTAFDASRAAFLTGLTDRFSP